MTARAGRTTEEESALSKHQPSNKTVHGLCRKLREQRPGMDQRTAYRQVRSVIRFGDLSPYHHRVLRAALMLSAETCMQMINGVASPWKQLLTATVNAARAAGTLSQEYVKATEGPSGIAAQRSPYGPGRSHRSRQPRLIHRSGPLRRG